MQGRNGDPRAKSGRAGGRHRRRGHRRRERVRSRRVARLRFSGVRSWWEASAEKARSRARRPPSRDHPAELEWEAELAARLGHTASGLDRSAAQPETPEPDDLSTDLDIDLRTIDLSPRLPRSGIEHRLRRNLGLSRSPDIPDIDLPPLPGQGIDGPDLGP